MLFEPPPPDCPLCPRLAAFRKANRLAYPAFFNAPVPSFGGLEAPLLIVGLAPGLKGANQTGRPFTGDYAGIVLYSALKRYGFAEGNYDPDKLSASGFQLSQPEAGSRKPEAAADGFRLIGCRITNAVRCVPPQNKPEPSEIRSCNAFLDEELASMPNLKVIVTLGQIAHKAVLMALGHKQSAYAFGHGARHTLAHEERGAQPLLLNSYHCSRYNINTGALTQAMFDAVIEEARRALR